MENLQPFDILLFRGTEIVSKIISKVSRLTSRHEGRWTHCGIILSSGILDHPRVHPGRLYIWEATMSGRLGDGIRNINGKGQLSVQLRDLQAVVAATLTNPDAEIGHGRLINKYRPELTADFKRDFTRFFYEVDGSHYNLNLVSVLATAFKPLRFVRRLFPRIGRRRWKICSELVADTLKFVGVYPDYIKSINVTPEDLVQPARDNDDNAVPKRYHSRVEIWPLPGDITSSSDSSADFPENAKIKAFVLPEKIYSSRIAGEIHGE